MWAITVPQGRMRRERKGLCTPMVFRIWKPGVHIHLKTLWPNLLTFGSSPRSRRSSHGNMEFGGQARRTNRGRDLSPSGRETIGTTYANLIATLSSSTGGLGNIVQLRMAASIAKSAGPTICGQFWIGLMKLRNAMNSNNIMLMVGMTRYRGTMAKIPVPRVE